MGKLFELWLTDLARQFKRKPKLAKQRTPETMNTLANVFLRVATWNVHQWQNPSDVLQKVLEIKPDIIGFQEMPLPSDPIDFVHEGRITRAPFTTWKNANSYDLNYLSVYTGNGMLSKWPFKDEVSHVMHTDPWYEKRCFVGGIVETPFGEMLIGTLHLDHLTEPMRMRQIETLFNFLDENQYSSLPQIITGDFNSLSEPSDYPPLEWEAIAKKRAQHHWERPKSDIYRSMIKAGYVDAWKAAGGNPSKASCWVGTRIDYIFTKNTENILVPKQAFVGCSDGGVSDHSMMVVDFEIHPDVKIQTSNNSADE